MLVNQLLRSTEDLLSSGGDDRQTVIENGEKLNKYFSSASPRPEVIRRGSCTCSTVDLNGYLEAEKVKIKLLTEVLTRNDGKQHMEVFDKANLGIISRLESLFNFHSSSNGVNDNHGIVLFPSGSDAEYLPLIVGLIRSYSNSVQHMKVHNSSTNSSTTSENTESRSEVVHDINKIKVYNNVIAAGEVGSGTSYACSGQHFSTVTPKDMSALPEASAAAHTHTIGELLEGIQPHWVETVEFKPRNSDGGVDFQETAIQNAIQQQMTTSDISMSILHVVLGSKTGLVYPSLNVVKKLVEAYGERLVVVVDACQLRCDLSVLKEFVDEGYMVLFTGSKFFTGPPFCGGVLAPGRIVSEIESHLMQTQHRSSSDNSTGVCMVATGLREYLTSYQVSAHMTELRRFLAAAESASNANNDTTNLNKHSSYFNIGLYLRWSIALPLMEAYHGPALTTQLKISYTDAWTQQIKSLVAKYSDFLCLVDSGNNKAIHNNNIYNRSNVDGIISIAVRVPMHNNSNSDNNSYSGYLSIEEKNSRSLSAGGNQSRYMSAEEKEGSSRYLSMDELKEYHKILTQNVKCGGILTEFINNNENKYKSSITTLNNKIMIGQPVKLCDAKKNTTAATAGGGVHVTNSNHVANTPTGVVRIALGVDMALSYAEQRQLEVTAQDTITVEKMYLVAKYWNFIGDTKNKAQNIQNIVANNSDNCEKKCIDKHDDNFNNHNNYNSNSNNIDINNATINNNNKFPSIDKKNNINNNGNDAGSTDINISAYSAELAHKLTTIDQQLNVTTLNSNNNSSSLSQAETVALMLQSAFGNDNSSANNSNNRNSVINSNSNNTSDISRNSNSFVVATRNEVNLTTTALTNSTNMPLVGLYYNLDTITTTISSLHSAFTTTLNSHNYSFYHCFAIKACPITYILHYIVHTMHCGLECASICEIKQALKVKCPVEVIVFDSPCKTSDEIMFVLSHNITMNINSYAELAKVEQCLGQLEAQGVFSRSVIGLRVNPMVGAGSNASLSTATATSKFGIPLYSKEVDCGQVPVEGLVSDFSVKIVQTYQENPFLTGIMCHVGSQGMPLHLMAEGAKRILSLADTIDSACRTADSNSGEVSQLAPRIKYIDIGGGLSANYSSDAVSPTFEEYASALAVACHLLCSNMDSDIQPAHKRTVITEFGKAIIAKSGTIVTAIEDVLIHSGEENYNPVESAEASTTTNTIDLPVVTAICHAGADLLLRTAYCYDKFPHRVALLDSNYQMLCDSEEINNSIVVKKNSSTIDNNTSSINGDSSSSSNNSDNNSSTTAARSKCTLTLAGPLCFSGDNIVQKITFPLPEVKDVVLVLDAGANTISMFSKHCSRQSPPVFVFRKAVNETVDDNNNTNTIGSVLGNNDKPNNKQYTVVCVREKESEDSVLQFWD